MKGLTFNLLFLGRLAKIAVLQALHPYFFCVLSGCIKYVVHISVTWVIDVDVEI